MQHRGPSMDNIEQSGYSLVELMVVVAIIGILALSMNFNYSPANSRLKQAARELYSNMQNTRIEAVKRNERWGIVFNHPGAGQYCICSNANVDSDCTDAGEVCESTFTLADYGSGVSFGTGDAADNCVAGAGCQADPIRYGTDSVVFQPTGSLSGFGGYVYLENERGTAYAVGTPTVTGAIIIQKWANGAWQ